MRYFASARAAAGVESEMLALPPQGCSMADVIHRLGERHGPQLSRVLGACSFLLDEIVVRSPQTQVHPSGVLDVLPPFAGG